MSNDNSTGAHSLCTGEISIPSNPLQRAFEGISKGESSAGPVEQNPAPTRMLMTSRACLRAALFCFAARLAVQPVVGANHPGNDREPIAVIELGAPAVPIFILRATIPVPPRTFPRGDGLSPFQVIDCDGVAIPAQAEIRCRSRDKR